MQMELIGSLEHPGKQKMNGYIPDFLKIYIVLVIILLPAIICMVFFLVKPLSSNAFTYENDTVSQNHIVSTAVFVSALSFHIGSENSSDPSNCSRLGRSISRNECKNLVYRTGNNASQFCI